MKTMRLVLSVWRLRVLNSCAEHRNAAEVGHALFAADVAVLDQAAEHDDAAVFDEHVGVDRALVGDEAVGIARVSGERGALELDLELHQRAVSVDLRRDLENGADFLALHGGERDSRCRRRCCCRCWCTSR